MKTQPILILCIGLALQVEAQVDYVPHPQFISTSAPHTRIDWIHAASGRYVIDFNNTVEFIPLENEQLNGSRVKMDLYKNDEIVKHFDFPVGNGNHNRIQIPMALELKKDDAVYFLVELHPEKETESYIFNIFPYQRRTTETEPSIPYKQTAGSEARIEENIPVGIVVPGRLRKSHHKVKGAYKPGYYSKRANNYTGWVDVLGFLFGL